MVLNGSFSIQRTCLSTHSGHTAFSKPVSQPIPDLANWSAIKRPLATSTDSSTASQGTHIGWKSQHVSSGLHTARHFLATVLLPEEVSRGRLLISIEERPRQSLLTLRVGSCIFHFRFWAVPRMRASLIGVGSLWSQLSTLGVGNG
jgi:hypothetical protein